MSDLTVAAPAEQAVATLPPKARGLTIGSVNDALELAKHLSESGLVPKDYVGKPGAIVAAIDLGLSVGLSAMQACQSIANINGRPSLWGDGALAVVMAHPDFYDIDEDSPEVAIKTGGRCAITRRRRDGTAKTVERRFTHEDAQRAGLLGKQGPWTTATGRMYQMRARAFAMRDLFADALKGLAVAEEAMDFEIVHTADPKVDVIMPRSKSGAAAPAPKSAAPAKPAPEANGAGRACTVLSCDRKEGNGKTWYAVRLRQGEAEAFDATTFSDSFAAVASELVGRLAYVELKSSEKNGRTYLNLVAIEPYEAPAEESAA